VAPILHQQIKPTCSFPSLCSVSEYVENWVRYRCRKISWIPRHGIPSIKATMTVFLYPSGVGRASSSKNNTPQNSLNEYLRISRVEGIRGRLHRRSPRFRTSTSRLQAKYVMLLTNIADRGYKNSTLSESLIHKCYTMLLGQAWPQVAAQSVDSRKRKSLSHTVDWPSYGQTKPRKLFGITRYGHEKHW
jgi:hypothetical protein